MTPAPVRDRVVRRKADRGTPNRKETTVVTIPEWAVGAFFGALAMGFLSLAALSAAARYVAKQRAKEEDRG